MSVWLRQMLYHVLVISGVVFFLGGRIICYHAWLTPRPGTMSSRRILLLFLDRARLLLNKGERENFTSMASRPYYEHWWRRHRAWLNIDKNGFTIIVWRQYNGAAGPYHHFLMKSEN